MVLLLFLYNTVPKKLIFFKILLASENKDSSECKIQCPSVDLFGFLFRSNKQKQFRSYIYIYIRYLRYQYY